MLLAFHGGGGNMDYQADDKYSGLMSKSEQVGYIAVFPNGYSPIKSGQLATWNAGNCCAGFDYAVKTTILAGSLKGGEWVRRPLVACMVPLTFNPCPNYHRSDYDKNSYKPRTYKIAFIITNSLAERM